MRSNANTRTESPGRSGSSSRISCRASWLRCGTRWLCWMSMAAVGCSTAKLVEVRGRTGGGPNWWDTTRQVQRENSLNPEPIEDHFVEVQVSQGFDFVLSNGVTLSVTYIRRDAPETDVHQQILGLEVSYPIWKAKR